MDMGEVDQLKWVADKGRTEHAVPMVHCHVMSLANTNM